MKKPNKIITYIFLILLGIIMIYPLLFLFSASFKSNEEIFSSISLLPYDISKVTFEAYKNGWQGAGKYSFSTFFANSFIVTIPVVIITIISSSLVAYGFARFNFPYKKLLFTLMISTIMLPSTIIMIPSYILFKNFGWLNTYMPFWIPALLGSDAYFIFMFLQFFRSIPRELDESAIIDGCNRFKIFTKIILPLSKPAIISAGIFKFIWTWNSFVEPLIYINSVSKYTVALGLKMSIDTQGGEVMWNEMMAMSSLAIIPPALIFFLAQKHFVEGISTSGLKG